MALRTPLYNPSSDGRRVLNPNQVATLILLNSKNKAKSRDAELYPRFKMRESKIAEIAGTILSSDERWALIQAMNELGWQVAISKTYWTFIKTSIVDRWPTLNNSEVIDLSMELSRSEKQSGTLSEEFDDFDIVELTRFFYSLDTIKEVVEDAAYEENWAGEELEEDELEEYIESIDLESDDIGKFLKPKEFSIWEYIYFDLVKGNLIEDVFKLKTKEGQ